MSVIMRYTLRLLTLDQLCAGLGAWSVHWSSSAPKRQDRYGDWPFEIGLWVGKAATPNHLGKKGDDRPDSARTKVRQYKSGPPGVSLLRCPLEELSLVQGGLRTGIVHAAARP